MTNIIRFPVERTRVPEGRLLELPPMSQAEIDKFHAELIAILNDMPVEFDEKPAVLWDDR